MDYVKLLEILGCPICQEVAIPPIYQCPKGHIICKDCLPNLQGRNLNCPSCRTILPKENIRSRPAEQFSESVEVKCKNFRNGCTRLLKAGDVSQHLSLNCRFEEDAWCKKVNLDKECRHKYFLKDFADHSQRFHDEDFYKIPANGRKTTLKMSTTSSSTAQVAFLPYAPSFFELPNGNIYILTANICKDTKTIKYQVFLNCRRSFGFVVCKYDDILVPITVTTSHCTVTWTLNPSKTRPALAGESPDNIHLLETYSLGLETLFPPQCFRRPALLKWEVTLDFPNMPFGGDLGLPHYMP